MSVDSEHQQLNQIYVQVKKWLKKILFVGTWCNYLNNQTGIRSLSLRIFELFFLIANIWIRGPCPPIDYCFNACVDIGFRKLNLNIIVTYSSLLILALHTIMIWKCSYFTGYKHTKALKLIHRLRTISNPNIFGPCK